MLQKMFNETHEHFNYNNLTNDFIKMKERK